MSVGESLYDIFKKNLKSNDWIVITLWFIFIILAFPSLMFTAFMELDYLEGETEDPFWGIPRHKVRTFYKWWYSILGVFLIITTILHMIAL